jgi:hypothetical protein
MARTDLRGTKNQRVASRDYGICHPTAKDRPGTPSTDDPAFSALCGAPRQPSCGSLECSGSCLRMVAQSKSGSGTFMFGGLVATTMPGAPPMGAQFDLMVSAPPCRDFSGYCSAFIDLFAGSGTARLAVDSSHVCSQLVRCRPKDGGKRR